jgi:cytoskeletal protein CcmA (bactofilin family)
MGIFSSKKPNLSEQNISTLIGEDCVINGNIRAKDYMRIDGTIEGNATIDNGLILGAKGVINGDVKAQEIIVYGTINGNLYSEKLEIKSSGRIKGTITTQKIEVEIGAIYNGSITMHPEEDMKSNKQLVEPNTKQLGIQTEMSTTPIMAQE